MLVLSRKTAESIDIGQDIQIRVLEIKGSRVKLAIQAPRSVSIRRTELPKHSGGGYQPDPQPKVLPSSIDNSLSAFLIESA